MFAALNQGEVQVHFVPPIPINEEVII